MEALKGVLKMFTRMLSVLASISYKERWDELRLFYLECWMLRGDLIEKLKTTWGIDGLDSQNHFLQCGNVKN